MRTAAVVALIVVALAAIVAVLTVHGPRYLPIHGPFREEMK